MSDDENHKGDDEVEAGEQTVRVQQYFVRHQSRLKAFVLSLQPDFAEAEDILQEVFLVVTRKAHEFEEGTNFTAWAFAIARFKILESLRRRKTKAVALSEAVIETLCAAAPEEELPEEQFAAVRACLDQLAPRMQEVLRMRYYREQGPKEIARVLSWTPNSVNVALSNARRLMFTCVARKLKEAGP
jgi:RNA polymerase sigma-70 factor (ECF subfamily)